MCRSMSSRREGSPSATCRPNAGTNELGGGVGPARTAARNRVSRALILALFGDGGTTASVVLFRARLHQVFEFVRRPRLRVVVNVQIKGHTKRSWYFAVHLAGGPRPLAVGIRLRLRRVRRKAEVESGHRRQSSGVLCEHERRTASQRSTLAPESVFCMVGAAVWSPSRIAWHRHRASRSDFDASDMLRSTRRASAASVCGRALPFRQVADKERRAARRSRRRLPA